MRFSFFIRRFSILIVFAALVMLSTSCESVPEDKYAFIYYGNKIVFNEVQRVTGGGGTPINTLGEYSVEISMSESNELLGYNIERCIPYRLDGLSITIDAGYRPPRPPNELQDNPWDTGANNSEYEPDELFRLEIWIHEPEREPYDISGKKIYICSSPVGVSGISSTSPDEGPWAYVGDVENIVSFAHKGVDVIFRIKPNPGYTDIYIASFVSTLDSQVEYVQADHPALHYYISGRMGVTAEEFIELVTKIIDSHQGR